MHSLKKFYLKTVVFDLLNKFHYKKITKLPEIKKIVLNFGLKAANTRQLFSALLALELLGKQKSFLTFTKTSNIQLKIRKGNPVGCKITLRNQNLFVFIEKNIFEILPKLKNFNGFNLNKKFQKNVFSYRLYNIFKFFELRTGYFLLKALPKLDVTIITTAQNKTELLFLLKAFQFSFLKV